MFAIDREKKNECTRCGDKFAAPSFTSDGMPMYGLCQRCNDQDEMDNAAFEDKEWESCDRCWGEGEIVDCVDDMCHGVGKCMHGGNVDCPECGGKGEILV